MYRLARILPWPTTPATMRGSTVTVLFLKSIPANDDTPIPSSMETTTASEASYAWVIAKPQAMQTIFPIPVGFTRDTINISADAVAVYHASACDVTPIFICNPFEPAGNTSESASEVAAAALHTNFAAGESLRATDRASQHLGVQSRSWQFRVPADPLGNGASVLAEALATGNPGTCYTQDSLDTETGAKAGPVEDGVNTRFGILLLIVQQGERRLSLPTGPKHTLGADDHRQGKEGLRYLQSGHGRSRCRRCHQGVAVRLRSIHDLACRRQDQQQQQLAVHDTTGVSRRERHAPSVSAILGSHSSYPATADRNTKPALRLRCLSLRASNSALSAMLRPTVRSGHRQRRRPVLYRPGPFELHGGRIW